MDSNMWKSQGAREQKWGSFIRPKLSSSPWTLSRISPGSQGLLHKYPLSERMENMSYHNSCDISPFQDKKESILQVEKSRPRGRTNGLKACDKLVTKLNLEMKLCYHHWGSGGRRWVLLFMLICVCICACSGSQVSFQDFFLMQGLSWADGLPDPLNTLSYLLRLLHSWNSCR